jgi:LysR family glycine cleavage system transcriptional activator
MQPIDRPSRLPPLHALRGFEAAARHSSFVKAADELSLTQSAVSHQVRQLEAALGQRLFHRQPREIVLTDAGRDFLKTVREALDLLNVGVARLAPYRSSGPLIVSCDAAFARHWLLPRLLAFRALRPDIKVWLDTSERLVDFDRQEVEVVLGRLRAQGTECSEEVLFDDYLGPCHGRPAPAPGGVRRVADLAGHTLLHDERREGWLVWLRAAGANTTADAALDATAGPRFSDPGLVIDAARGGQGIALASDVLAGEDLAAGTLQAPLDQWLRVPDAYRLAVPRWLETSDSVAAFAAFIRSQAQEYRKGLDQRRRGATVIHTGEADPRPA